MPATGLNGFLRVQTRSSYSGPLGRHVAGKNRPDTAVGKRPGYPAAVVELTGDPEGALARAAARLPVVKREARRHRGPRAKPVVEFVVAGPPAFDHPDCWSPERVMDWARRSFQWVSERAGSGSVVAVAALHADESRPHCHFLVLAAGTDNRPGWPRIRPRFLPDAVRGQKLGRREMGAVIDRYCADLGVPRVGRGGGPKKSLPPDRAMAVVARVRELERHGRAAARERDERDAALRDERARTSAAFEAARINFERQLAMAQNQVALAERGRDEARRELAAERRSRRAAGAAVGGASGVGSGAPAAPGVKDGVPADVREFDGNPDRSSAVPDDGGRRRSRRSR